MPLLTLSTDIGQQDYIAGAVKGQILSLNPAFNIADITHYLPQENYAHAAYICSNAFKHYPAGTFHMVIVSLFEKVPSRILVALHQQQYIACADNGLLTMITGGVPDHVVALPVPPHAHTLQLTQVMASAIHAISSGTPFLQVGTLVTDIVEKSSLKPTIGQDWIEGQVLFIDNFENVVINITRNDFEEQRKGRTFRIIFKRNETLDTISDHYAAVHEGEKLAWFNAAGYLELAINKGNMAGLFGLQTFKEKMHIQGAAPQNKWFYQTVRIFFE